MVGRATPRIGRAARRPSRSAAVLGIVVALITISSAGSGVMGSHLAVRAAPAAFSARSNAAHPTDAGTRPGASPIRDPSGSEAGLTPSVVRTFFPDYNASVPGNFSGSVWDWQVGTPTYVPSTQTVWLPVRSIAKLPGPVPSFAPALIYSAKNDSFEGFIPSIQDAAALLFDPSNGYVYSADFSNNTVGVVNSQTGDWIRSIPVGDDPDALALNATSDQIYVANQESDFVTVVNCTSNSVTSDVSSPAIQPSKAVFDPSDDSLLLISNKSTSLWAVNLSTGHNASFSLAADPEGIAFDEQTAAVAITMPSDSHLLLLSADSLSTIGFQDVGSGLGPIASSSYGGEFVAGTLTFSNSTLQSSLLQINASTGNVSGAPIPAGASVTEIVSITGTEEFAAWAAVSRNITTVDVATSTALFDSATLGPEPNDLALDPVNDRAFLVSAFGGHVVAIDDASGTMLAQPWWFGSPAYSIAYDNLSNILFVGTQRGIDAVSPIVGQILYSESAVPGDAPFFVDNSDGYLWEDTPTIGLIALSLSNLQEAYALPVVAPSEPPVQQNTMALDPTHDDLFVVNESAHNVEEVDVETGSIISSALAGGTGASAIAYDPADEDIYVVGTTAAGINVTILNPSTGVAIGPPIPLVARGFATGIAYDPSLADLLVTTAQSNLTEYLGSLVVLDGSSPGAGFSSQINTPLSDLPVDPNVGTLPGTSAPAEDGIWVANLASGTISVVGTAPAITSSTASPNPVDVGQTTQLRIAYDGGTGPISATYAGLPPGCSSSDTLSLDCTPTQGGNFTIVATLEDAFGLEASSTVELNVSSSFTVSIATLLGITPALDVGEMLTADAQPTGGTPSYTYVWSFGDGTNTTGSVAEHSWSQPGTYVLAVTAIDATGVRAFDSIPIAVTADPVATIVASPGNETDVNLPVSFSSDVEGGSGYLVASWTFGDGTTATGIEVNHTWSSAGSYQVDLTYTDRSGFSSSYAEKVVVSSALGASISATASNSSGPPTAGGPVEFVATVSGGTAPYTVTWSFGDGSFATGPTTELHTYGSAGRYPVNVTIVDGAGARLSESLTLTVGGTSSNSTNPLTGGDFELGIFFGAMIGLAVALVAVFVASRHRRPPRRPPPASPYVPPAEVETPNWRED